MTSTPHASASNAARSTIAGSDDAQMVRQQLRDADRLHHVHSFTDHSALQQNGGAFIAERGEGSMLVGEGNIRLLDAMAGLGCVNVGYGRKEMAQAAADAMQDLAYYHSFQATTNPHAAALAERIAKAAPGALNHVFFANSGSEANESILKLVRAYWRAKGQPNRQHIIARDYAYHGSTLFTTSLNGLPPMHEAFGLPLSGVSHIEAPYWYRQGGDLDPEAYGKKAARSLKDKITELGADQVAAFIAEPIQVTSGVIMPPESYWPEIVAICKQEGILLIADEVVTGFGRTGHWFAQNHYGIEADFMTLAKGLSSGYMPIAAAVISDKVAEMTLQQGGAFQHGFTTSGHPVACAVALKNLDIIVQEGLVERAAKMGAVLHSKLNTAIGDHPLVGEVRGMGLLAGIELVRDRKSRSHYPLELGLCSHVANAALMQGVIVRATGNSLVICPPFIITEAEIDVVVAALVAALEQIYGQLQAG
ncbi:aspartate aminotransferase family protein [Iodidimonas muriae]|uniref:Aspartate aminotransferase family protein n=1 Tax=Iodidimonas muriae TaxID=261467 RepID=A0ABQ2L5K5_9PROT|nr:aminotransferase [Iodidimonas muriae]GER06305.1 aspartate aminotransferase family protein [Kordiimonadales bacterium JCM 17843]GGO04236.1 aspartate aminotransferase family protein [Iodidimonas muriae]